MGHDKLFRFNSLRIIRLCYLRPWIIPCPAQVEEATRADHLQLNGRHCEPADVLAARLPLEHQPRIQKAFSSTIARTIEMRRNADSDKFAI